MATMYAEFGDKSFELTVSLRVAQKINQKFKQTTEQVMSRLVDGPPEEIVNILKTGLADKEREQELEDTVMDGGFGMAHLRNVTGAYLLELSYPGTPEEKEAAVAASFGADETAKNGLRQMLGLPVKSSSAPRDSGSK